MNTFKYAVSLAFLTLFVSPASGQEGADYTLTNNTGSAGGTFPITTLETFQTLDLTETFADLSTLTIPLYRAGLPVTSLSVFQVRAVTHGVDLTNVIQSHISGQFSSTSVQIATTSGGSKTPVTILPSFSSLFTPPTQNSFAYILAVDSVTGQTYKAGRFNTTPIVLLTATPEPGSILLFLSAATVGCLILRRRKRCLG